MAQTKFVGFVPTETTTHTHKIQISIISRSGEGLVKTMAVKATIFQATGLTVSEQDTGRTLLRTPGQTHRSPSKQQARGINRQPSSCALGGITHESDDVWLEIDRRIRLMRACLKRFCPEYNDRTTAPLSLRVRMLKAEVIENLMYVCVTWILRADKYAKLRKAHYQVLFLATHRLPAPTAYRPSHPLVRQGPQDDIFRKHRNDYP